MKGRIAPLDSTKDYSGRLILGFQWIFGLGKLHIDFWTATASFHSISSRKDEAKIANSHFKFSWPRERWHWRRTDTYCARRA